MTCWWLKAGCAWSDQAAWTDLNGKTHSIGEATANTVFVIDAAQFGELTVLLPPKDKTAGAVSRQVKILAGATTYEDETEGALRVVREGKELANWRLGTIEGETGLFVYTDEEEPGDDDSGGENPPEDPPNPKPERPLPPACILFR